VRAAAASPEADGADHEPDYTPVATDSARPRAAPAEVAATADTTTTATSVPTTTTKGNWEKFQKQRIVQVLSLKSNVLLFSLKM